MSKIKSAPIIVHKSVTPGMQGQILNDYHINYFKIILELIFVIFLFSGFIFLFYLRDPQYKCQDHKIYKKINNEWIKKNDIC